MQHAPGLCGSCVRDAKKKKKKKKKKKRKKEKKELCELDPLCKSGPKEVRVPGAPSPSMFFIFMQFWENFAPNNKLSCEVDVPVKRNPGPTTDIDISVQHLTVLN